MEMELATDEELLRRIATGDTAAFEALYDRYASAAYGLALRILAEGKSAEDVVQDVFLNVWRMAGSYNVHRGAARSWLLGMVHHRAVDVYRRARGRPVLSAESAAYQVAGADDLWDKVVAAVDGEILHKALAGLPPDQREVIELAYFSGLSHREIAEERGIPLGTVKSRIRIAMARLRDSLRSQRAEP